MLKIKPSSVDEYIDASPLFAQEKLREICSILRKVAPNAIEMLRWGYPVLFEREFFFPIQHLGKKEILSLHATAYLQDILKI